MEHLEFVEKSSDLYSKIKELIKDQGEHTCRNIIDKMTSELLYKGLFLVLLVIHLVQIQEEDHLEVSAKNIL